MEKQKCPEIRFDGFKCDWEQTTLGNFTIFRRGSFPQPYGNKEWYGGKNSMPFVQVVDVRKDLKLVQDTKQKISLKAQSYSVFVPKGRVIVTLQGTIGRVAITQYDSFVDRTILIFEGFTQNTDSLFWAYTIQNKFDLEKKTAPGGTIKTITKNALSSFEVLLPLTEEQIQIGEFFQNLDQSIALYKKKLAQTQNFKKAMLEKMFPKQGSMYPEIRLKGFSGDWEPFTLGSLCHIGDIDHRMPDSREQGIPYLMTGDFIGINELDFKNAKRISNEDYEQLAKKIKPEAGDILFARYASVGTVRYVKTHLKFLISYSCTILKTSINSNGEYLFYYLQTKCSQNQIEQEINTGSQRNIGIDSLKKLSILMPKDDEQRAIADFFRKIDENLVLQEKQLQTLKNLKQAFLEKMFV